MINKIKSFAENPIVIIIIGAIIIFSVLFQIFHLYKFVNAGKRFTSQDGQELCYSIRELQRINGLPERECKYGE